MKAPRFFKQQQRSGIALVLVLSILILLTAVVVAFFTNATTDLTASKGYSDANRVKLLGDSAVNLVEAQIREGTKGGTGGSPEAWASQPGIIQTYDDQGVAKKSFKLYSSGTLQVDGRFKPSSNTTTEVPDDWYKRPGDYVDLNSPSIVTDPNAKVPDPTLTNAGPGYSARFPIVDGNNLKTLNGYLTYNANLSSQGAPASTGPNIEGFYVQPPTSYDSTKLLAPNNNPVAMPVQWLYVLQDGQLQPRTPGSGAVTNATAANPIVGRVAFWTDDDTSKLNINVNAEGTDWSQPRGLNRTEYTQIATKLPAQNEFQMFPGHPAKTCLSTVFGAIFPPSQTASADGSYSLANLFTDAGSYNMLLPYYDLVPRVTQGATYGSAGGTKAVASASSGIPYDADRLYTSVDEIMFKTQTGTGNDGALTRVTRSVPWNVDGAGAQAPGIPASFLETSRFFLTASNRAPEVTLLNTPRISLWPLLTPAQVNLESGKERLLAFCGTIPSSVENGVATGYPYYFQRANVAGGSAGATAMLSSDSPTMDFTAVSRNTVLYNYLQNLLKVQVPGLGGSFQGKYPATYQQITTEVMDQLRSGVNTWPANNGTGQSYNYTQNRGNPAEGQVVPLLAPASTTANVPFGNTKGFGRFTTITEAALDLFRADDPSVNKTGPIQIGAMLILQPFNPSPGFPTWSPDYQVTVQGLEAFSIHPVDPPAPYVPQFNNLGFLTRTDGGITNNGTNVLDTVVGFTCIGNPSEFNTLITTFTSGAGKKAFAPATNPGAYFNRLIYPFINFPAAPDPKSIDPVKGTNGVGQLPAGTQHFDLNADQDVTISVSIYANPVGTVTGTHGPLIQTLQMTFPASQNLPVPVYNAGKPTLTAAASGGNSGVAGILTARLNGAQGNTILGGDDQPNDNINSAFGAVGCGAGMIGKADVVRSVVVDVNTKNDPKGGPSKGDLRVIAGLKNVPPNYFAPHPFYKAYGSGITPAPYSNPPSSFNQYNYQFADSLKIGDLPGWGGLGYYAYGSSTGYLHATGPGPVYRKSAYTGSLVPNLSTTDPTPPYNPDFAPAVPVGLNGAFMYAQDGTTQVPGDWDTGMGNLEDGPYINKPDEGNANNSSGATGGYFARQIGGTDLGGSYSPNRERASAVDFGSLPTGIDQSVGVTTTIKPWQTLLFCANPASGLYSTDTRASALHPGFGAMVNPDAASGSIPAPPYRIVPDHYMLDLFTMPIVEPYAISEPLSSQGKVNMNYQIAPFTYIHRETGVRAVLKGSRMLAIPSTTYSLQHYKSLISPDTYQFRYDINPDDKTGTLKAFEDRFNTGDIFHSASEICSVPLVPAQIPGQSYDPGVQPANPTATTLQQFWNNCRLTGDNVREEPYNDIYPRLTTKSNTYTVHVRVQTLKKVTGDQTVFLDPNDTTVRGAKDAVTAEYRGSYQIERYIDPNVSPTRAAGSNTSPFPDYATIFPAVQSNQMLSNFYKFHTIGTKQF